MRTRPARYGGLTLSVFLTFHSVPTDAQPTSGFIEYELSALGAGGHTTGAVGGGRLPVRPGGSVMAPMGLTVRASGSRGSVRSIVLGIAGAGPGVQSRCGDGGSMVFTFASGSEVSARRGACEITVLSLDAERARGSFTATLVRDRVSMSVRGRFDAPFGGH